MTYFSQCPETCLNLVTSACSLHRALRCILCGSGFSIDLEPLVYELPVGDAGVLSESSWNTRAGGLLCSPGLRRSVRSASPTAGAPMQLPWAVDPPKLSLEVRGILCFSLIAKASSGLSLQDPACRLQPQEDRLIVGRANSPGGMLLFLVWRFLLKYGSFEKSPVPEE